MVKVGKIHSDWFFLIEKPWLKEEVVFPKKRIFNQKKPNKSFETSYSDKADLKHLCHNKLHHCCD